MTTATSTSLMPLSVLDDDANRAAPLREAAALLDGTTAEYRKLVTTCLWRDRISQAQQGQYPWTGKAKN